MELLLTFFAEQDILVLSQFRKGTIIMKNVFFMHTMSYREMIVRNN